MSCHRTKLHLQSTIVLFLSPQPQNSQTILLLGNFEEINYLPSFAQQPSGMAWEDSIDPAPKLYKNSVFDGVRFQQYSFTSQNHFNFNYS